ncbi:MAG: 3-oxoacyl-[acyl-carrier protein] reductase [Sediminicola sp.]|jgi:3-oxoacyl-[acyl-carrier protein] reductase|uniref:SDR family oxidoreductase n=1 Tax=Nonlabens sp. TaxID=1888209 RepID=UPI0039E65872|tara:strand:+ start:2254 stop:2994 length:741 start_codon:yes stop_codon:yes gene_type:complete
MNKLKGKVIIITGSSRGIGLTIAKTLAKNGAKVVVNFSSSEETAKSVVTEILQSGGQAIAIKADVSKSEDVKRLFQKTIEKFEKIDVLINNAGIAIYKLIKDTTDEDFDRIFDVNVKGVFNTMREASTLLGDNGRIINFSSSVTRLMLPTYGTYSATKSAVEQLTRVFAKEVGTKGITVNSISPGPVNTELFKQGKNEEVIKRLASMSAFNRIGEPEDIAKIVLFLVDDDSKWITGQNIGVNGGFA